MKVNSINSINTINNNSYKQSFKHTAVPYPEYEKAYLYADKSSSFVSSIINKISDLFNPEVTKEAVEIKSKIDKLYSVKTPSPKEHLLSVLA